MTTLNKQDFPTIQEYLNYRFIYRDGELYWRTHVSSIIVGCRVADRLLGRKSRKVLYIKVDGKDKIKSRVIWIMHYGDIPSGMVVDHEDRDRFNNYVENFRLLTTQDNLLNTDKILQAHNTSGYRGVRKKSPGRPKPWSCYINTKGLKHSKSFETAKEAAIYRDKYIDDHNLLLVKNF